MPLIMGKGKRAMSDNIRTEMDSGRPQKQAIAMAYSMAKKAHAKKMAMGGSVPKLGDSRHEMDEDMPTYVGGRGGYNASMHMNDIGHSGLGIKRAEPGYGIKGFSQGGFVEEQNVEDRRPWDGFTDSHIDDHDEDTNLEPEMFAKGGMVGDEDDMRSPEESLEYPMQGVEPSQQVESPEEDDDRKRFLLHFMMKKTMRR